MFGTSSTIENAPSARVALGNKFPRANARLRPRLSLAAASPLKTLPFMTTLSLKDRDPCHVPEVDAKHVNLAESLQQTFPSGHHRRCRPHSRLSSSSICSRLPELLMSMPFAPSTPNWLNKVPEVTLTFSGH